MATWGEKADRPHQGSRPEPRSTRPAGTSWQIELQQIVRTWAWHIPIEQKTATAEYIRLQTNRSRVPAPGDRQIKSRFGGNHTRRCLFSVDLFEESIGNRPESLGLEHGLRLLERVETPGGIAAWFSAICPMDRQIRIGPAQS
ncbi:MAG TPA: hypothetical protein DIC23_03540 [Planctomycetaceae bacterium]|nr:hypothetical protein [Planctomycetaceae bacterium]